MNILLTGANGFSGKALLNELSKNHRVIAHFGRKTKSVESSLNCNSNIEIIFGDLFSLQIDRNDIDVVIHAAAISPGPGINYSNNEYLVNNVLATQKLIDWACNNNVKKMIYFSSISTNGDIQQECLDESSPRINPDIYGVSKWMGELFLEEVNELMPSLSIRLPGVIGFNSKRNWLSTMINAAKSGNEISYFNGAADYNNAVHINDLVNLIVQVLDKPVSGSDIVTLGAKQPVKVNDMVDTIIDGFGGKASKNEYPAPRPAFIISSERAIEKYGYNPMSMDQMLLRFIEENK